MIVPESAGISSILTLVLRILVIMSITTCIIVLAKITVGIIYGTMNVSTRVIILVMSIMTELKQLNPPNI